jgi:colicin import membrane protein
MTTPRSGWRSLGLSIGLHGLLVAAVAVGYLKFHASKPVEQRLAIEATVVTGLPTTIRSAPEPAPRPEPQPEPQREPPPPDPAIVQQAARDAQHRKEKAEAAVAEERRLAQQTEAAQRQAAAAAAQKKAEAEKAARLKTEADKLEQLKAAQKAAQALERSRREAELNAQIAAEERVAAARSSTQMAQYVAQITARIEREWIRPATAKAGLECEVRVTQVPGGAVVGVKVAQCNGDESVRQSIEAAVYRASPLPQPSDIALFERNLVVTFRPQD